MFALRLLVSTFLLGPLVACAAEVTEPEDPAPTDDESSEGSLGSSEQAVSARCDGARLAQCIRNKGGDAACRRQWCDRGRPRGQTTRECRISGICE